MTKKELEKGFKGASAEMDAVIQDARSKRSEAIKEYIEKLPFKVGDLVETTDFEGKKKTAFIGYVGENYSGIYISFNKAKKDGTMGQQSASIYSYESIELIKQS